jgi:glycosyltransferase involved in cell wall biosynthesis
MRYWPTDTCLVLIGATNDDFRNHVGRLATEVGAADRVVVLPFVAYPGVLDLISGADIGLALYDGPQQKGQWAFAGTASNKALEYVAAGIPFLVNDNPSSAIFITAGVAVPVDPSDERELASAIRALMDRTLRRVMGAKALALHHTHLNFEHCFSKLDGSLEVLVRMTTPGLNGGH